MPGETQLHKTLKKEACRWMFRMGYRTIAAEVRVPPVGIVDAVGTGYFKPYSNYLSVPTTLPTTCFIEAKASRSDFTRDKAPDGQLTFCLKNKKNDRLRQVRGRGHKIKGQADLGKFGTCLLCPMANLHYIIAPAGLLKKADLPPRWGLLTLGENGVQVTVRPDWVESGRIGFVESAVARTLTGDIYRADSRAIGSVNREIATQQAQLAERLKKLTPTILEQMEGSAELKKPKATEPVDDDEMLPTPHGLLRPQSKTRRRRRARR